MTMAAMRLRSFRHGVHPAEHKHLSERHAIERMPFVAEYVLPLAQHIGAPSRPVVAPGQAVRRGQVVAEPGGFVSVALHAPVAGKVVAVEPRLGPNGQVAPAVVIHTDPFDSQRLPLAEAVDPGRLSASEFVRHVQMGGLVGLGGAAFPSHVKMQVPEGKRVEAVVLNGCECEPYLTCDHRVMLEHAGKVLRGAEIMRRHVGAARVYVGVEANKPDAIEALGAIDGDGVEVVPLQVKYPQGAEKTLIEAIFKKEVPAGGLPLDLSLLVHNVGTAAALADLFDRGAPLIERVVTVTGPAVRQPKNLLVPIGTPVSAILEHCGGLLPSARQVVLGGPMMGMAQKSLEAPLAKGVSGILCMDRVSALPLREHACVRCGRCADACPMFLQPWRLAQLARAERPETLEAYHLLSCFECASCSFVCPSNIPLVQWMRMGKGMIRKAKAAAKAG